MLADVSLEGIKIFNIQEEVFSGFKLFRLFLVIRDEGVLNSTE